MEHMITIDRLQKRYAQRVVVVDGSPAIVRGEIFGVVGPNGAGKITTVECLSSICFFAAGCALAAVAPSARAAQTIGMAIFFPMLFLSGAAMPRALMPEHIQRISDFLPLTYVTTLLSDL